ncbi:TIGR02452 family protein [Kitasatospora sp. NBC_01287]|uniref:TIGR02452 family protein n=1 Tax=Kitasatospora sp. NBC_01287 TaxID=2903573 RepID=UPI00225AD388|nr:TIGR02452 family protein [Kitasatospora sp. NBC_01287]MCX4747477.1 TIGR02452 family protein [Kitasatospora sp. NBC_01287]
MSSRLHQVARENEEIAERGDYRAAGGRAVAVGGALAAARAGTVAYGPGPDDVPPGAPAAVPAPGPGDLAAELTAGPTAGLTVGLTVEVTAEGSLEAADRLVRAGGTALPRVGVLNFASARNPGGGYLRGARAQEEDLCRTALLYHCLLAAPDHYAAHRASTDLRYSHRVIFSPDVPVIRDGHGALLARPYPVSFLTAAAPNAGQLALRGETADLRGLLAERATRVLAVAARHEVRQLVLGAWGCGVFRNDPAQVAEAFAVALASYGAAFERVVFAVRDRSPVSANRAAFEARFGGVTRGRDSGA